MKRMLLSSMLAIVVATAGCGRKTAETKSMDTLYRENGVPVRVATIEPGLFSSQYRYHAVLTGFEESTASAPVTDEVEKILFKVGDHVKKDQTVVTFPTDNPSTQYFQVKASLEHAETTLKRIRNLYDNGGVSLQEYENTKTQYEVIKANWDALQKAVKVPAPIDGVITGIDVRVADNVRAGDRLFTVSNTQKLKAELWANEDQIRGIVKGSRATATWRDVRITGRVVQADLSIDHKRQGFGIVLEFDNPGEKMNSGVNAEIRIEGRTDSRVVLVDRKNVQTEGDSAFVFVAVDSVAVKRSVTLGRRHDSDVEVLRGIGPGDRLITEGQMLLSDGAKIKIVQE